MFPALGEERSSPLFFETLIMKNLTKDISVFVDESGTLGADKSASRFYFVCMVFHDQRQDITDNLRNVENAFVNMGLPGNLCVHAGPLIRREKEYAKLSREERRGIFNRMVGFLRQADISYACFKVDKARLGNSQRIHDPLLQSMLSFLIAKANLFTSYDTLKVYYDNGQAELTKLLKEAFAIFSSRTSFIPAVEPSHYRLFQAADIICTLELARAKLDTPEGLSLSGKTFFGGIKNLKKNYLKILDRKQLK